MSRGYKVLPTSEWHEDNHCSIFISFSRDENGEIIEEPPEACIASGYLDDDFDEEKWTHFIDFEGGSLNFLFTDADPIRFPEV